MQYNVNILYRLVDSFFRHRYLFLAAVLTTTGATVAGLKLRRTTYKESALIRIIPNEPTVALGDYNKNMTLVGASPAEQNVERLNALLRDDRPGGFLDSALKEAKLERPLNIDPAAKDPRFASLCKNLVVREDSDKLFSITLTWDHPRECERILGALQDQYIEEVGRGQQAQAVATVTFLDNQIQSYEQRLRVAEKALIDYRQHHAGQSPEAQTADFSELATLKAKLDDLRITSKDNELKRHALKVRIAQINPMNIKEQTIGDNPMTLQIRELAARRNSLLADGWLATSFRVQAIDEQIAKLNEQVKKERKRMASRRGNVSETKLQNNPEYESLMQELTNVGIAQTTQQTQVQQLEKRISEYENRISEMPASERALADKMRNYTVLKTQYENLLQRREEARLKANLDKVSARSKLGPIGVIAAEPTLDSKKKALILVGSVFLSLIVGLAMVFLREWTDPSLRYESDTERILGLPVLAMIAHSKDLCLPVGARSPVRNLALSARSDRGRRS